MSGKGKKAISEKAHVEEFTAREIMAFGEIEDAGEKDALVAFMKKKLCSNKSIFPSSDDPQ